MERSAETTRDDPDGEYLKRNRWFESGFLQRGVCCEGPLSLLLATAQLNNVEPFAYLRDVLERMVEGHSASRLDELLPWNWKPAGLIGWCNVNGYPSGMRTSCQKRVTGSLIKGSASP